MNTNKTKSFGLKLKRFIRDMAKANSTFWFGIWFAMFLVYMPLLFIEKNYIAMHFFSMFILLLVFYNMQGKMLDERGKMLDETLDDWKHTLDIWRDSQNKTGEFMKEVNKIVLDANKTKTAKKKG